MVFFWRVCGFCFLVWLGEFRLRFKKKNVIFFLEKVCFNLFKDFKGINLFKIFVILNFLKRFLGNKFM